MFKKSILHAWHSTLASLGFPALLWPLIAIPLVGFALHYFLSGYYDMSGELHIWLIYGLASTGVVFMSLFLINLFCAPYRIERDARLQLEVEACQLRGRARGQTLKEFWTNRDYFTVKEVACLLAGSPISNGPITGIASGHLYDICKQIKNGSISPTNLTRMQIHQLNMSKSFPDMDGNQDKWLENVELTKADTLALGVTIEDQ